ncbi:hypothetical protein M426DRAFT_9015 [Hypoxylon sp. CI-4A]|nr:hypothetical protein M426DRAFT_9015 [Hypoxylon sp. CI-4A]
MENPDTPTPAPSRMTANINQNVYQHPGYESTMPFIHQNGNQQMEPQMEMSTPLQNQHTSSEMAMSYPGPQYNNQQTQPGYPMPPHLQNVNQQMSSELAMSHPTPQSNNQHMGAGSTMHPTPQNQQMQSGFAPPAAPQNSNQHTSSGMTMPPTPQNSNQHTGSGLSMPPTPQNQLTRGGLPMPPAPQNQTQRMSTGLTMPPRPQNQQTAVMPSAHQNKQPRMGLTMPGAPQNQHTQSGLAMPPTAPAVPAACNPTDDSLGFPLDENIDPSLLNMTMQNQGGMANSNAGMTNNAGSTAQQPGFQPVQAGVESGAAAATTTTTNAIPQQEEQTLPDAPNDDLDALFGKDEEEQSTGNDDLDMLLGHGKYAAGDYLSNALNHPAQAQQLDNQAATAGLPNAPLDTGATATTTTTAPSNTAMDVDTNNGLMSMIGANQNAEFAPLPDDEFAAFRDLLQQEIQQLDPQQQQSNTIDPSLLSNFDLQQQQQQQNQQQADYNFDFGDVNFQGVNYDQGYVDLSNYNFDMGSWQNQ